MSRKDNPRNLAGTHERTKGRVQKAIKIAWAYENHGRIVDRLMPRQWES